MPFAALGDDFHDSPKILAAGNAAVGVYARALSYCVDHLTDGVVPKAWAASNAKPAEIKALTNVGLWIAAEPGETFNVATRQGGTVDVNITVASYFIRDFAAYNDTKAFVERRRQEKRDAGKKGAKARWGDSTSDSRSHSDTHGSSDNGGTAEEMPSSPSTNTNPIDEPQEETFLRDEGEVEKGKAALDAIVGTVAAAISAPTAADDDIPF